MTSDKSTTIDGLQNRIHKFINDRDWYKYHNPKDIALSISIEAGELLENFQWVNTDDLTNIIKDKHKLSKIEEELADVFIYCIDLASVCNIDISKAILNKIKQNEQKYPIDKVKGKYIKYSEL